MADLNYNGEVVNSAVSKLVNIAREWDTLSNDIKKSTNLIVSSRGFDKYIGGINNDSFSSIIGECRQANDSLVQIIRQNQVKILSYSQDDGEIQAFLDELERSDYKSLDLSSIDDHISLGRKACNVLKGFTSSLATAGLGLVEGIMDFGETGADLITLGKSCFASIFTKGYDLINGTNETEKLWEETRAKVSEKKVESIFDSFYANNSVGQKIKANAYGFDTVRNIGNGIGYSAGLIGVNVISGGLASGLGIGAAGTVSVGQMAATAGIMGFSKGTEDAWNDGAETGKGLLYGAASGAWEGFQWGMGAKINQYGGIGDRIASGLFKGAKAGVATRIALDTIDSGTEGFVQPALSMIYKHYDGESLFDQYKNAFNANGGWGSVFTQAAIGGIMSAGSELMDARRILKSANGEGTGGQFRKDEVFGEDLAERELIEAECQASGDYSRSRKSTIDGDYVHTKDTVFNSKSNVKGIPSEGYRQFADGAYVPVGSTDTARGLFKQFESNMSPAQMDALIEANKMYMSGADYTRLKAVNEIFKSNKVAVNPNQLKLILDHSEGNVGRIASILKMSYSDVSDESIDRLANEIAASSLFQGQNKLYKNTVNGLIDIMRSGGRDNWYSGEDMVRYSVSVDYAMKRLDASTPDVKLQRLNNFFGNGYISDDMAKQILASDGYPASIRKILASNEMIPESMVRDLSVGASSKIFFDENIARIKACMEVENLNFDNAIKLTSKSGVSATQFSDLIKAGEIFNPNSARMTYYHLYDSFLDKGMDTKSATSQAKKIYSNAIFELETTSEQMYAMGLFNNDNVIFNYKQGVFEGTQVPKTSEYSDFMKKHYMNADGTINRDKLIGDFDKVISKSSGPSSTARPGITYGDNVKAADFYADAYKFAANPNNPNNEEALRFMSKLLELDSQGRPIHIVNISDGGCSYRLNDTINLGNSTLTTKSAGTVYHETGHYMFGNVLNTKVPTDFEAVRIRAVSTMNSGGNRQLFNDYISNISEERYFANYKSTVATNDAAIKLGYDGISGYRQHLIDSYSGQSAASVQQSVINRKVNAGLGTVGNYAKVSGNIDWNNAARIADYDIATLKATYQDAFARNNLTGYATTSGMMDSMTKSTQSAWYGHTREYFARRPIDGAYHELIADYSALRVSGNYNAIYLLRRLYGNEVIDMLENTYQTMLM